MVSSPCWQITPVDRWSWPAGQHGRQAEGAGRQVGRSKGNLLNGNAAAFVPSLSSSPRAPQVGQGCGPACQAALCTAAAGC